MSMFDHWLDENDSLINQYKKITGEKFEGNKHELKKHIENKIGAFTSLREDKELIKLLNKIENNT